MKYDMMTLHYGATFGRGDGSDWLDWEIFLDDDQEKAFKRAVMTMRDLEGVPEIRNAIDDVYEEIKDQETENLMEMEDEYTMECMGLSEMDADVLNDLVHKGDEHAIEFFKLQALSQEELQAWDANNLEELPLVKDFDPDFEPYSPFDEGWDLSVFPPDVCDIEVEDSEVEEYISEALDGKDFMLVCEVVDARDCYYEGDLKAFAFTTAESKGCVDELKKAMEEYEKKEEDDK